MMHNMAAPIVQRNWWIMALRGLFAVIFGLIALVAPGIALLAFIYVFAAYALVDGGIAVITAIQERELLYRWGWVLFEGVLSILAGIFAFANPALTALVLLYIMAAWVIVTGVMEIVAAFAIRELISREWVLALAGIVSVAFGIILFFFPVRASCQFCGWLASTGSFSVSCSSCAPSNSGRGQHRSPPNCFHYLFLSCITSPHPLPGSV
jgi:uncharacterized membrane protein HdeD (DUF308 family)